MRKSRIWTLAASLSVAGSAFALGMPQAEAASIPSGCLPSVNEGRFSVQQTGISIRATPGGRILGPISKSATFVAIKYASEAPDWTCVTHYTNDPFPPFGTQWVYGQGQASKTIGWVGLNYIAPDPNPL
jgi:hypothetical protein